MDADNKKKQTKKTNKKKPAPSKAARKVSANYTNLVPDPNNKKHERIFRFVQEYVVDFNLVQASRRAGYAEKSSLNIGSQLLSNPNVQLLVDKEKAALAKRVEITQEEMLRKWLALADADINELCEHRRVCCRTCWGTDFAYQETPQECRERTAKYDHDLQWAQANGTQPPLWDEEIEIGYRRNKAPNPECPNCDGEGYGKAFFKDTRTLSEGAKMAYQGVKVGKDGTEIKVADTIKARDAVSRHIGFFDKDNKIKIEGDLTEEELDLLFASRIKKAFDRQKSVDEERGNAT